MISIEEQLESLPRILKSFETKIHDLELSKHDVNKMQTRLDQLDEKITSRKYPIDNVHVSNMLEMQALLNYAAGRLNQAKANIKEAINTSGKKVLVTTLAMSMADSTSSARTKRDKVDTDELPEYFTVPTARLLFLGIPTLGIYNIYWVYKNWKAIEKFPTINKKGKPIPVHPVLSSIFFPLTSYEMFSRVRTSMQDVEPTRKVRAGLYAWSLLFLNLIGLSSFPIILMQKHMNYIKKNVYGDERIKKGISWGEVLIVIVGLIYVVTVVASNASNGSTSLTAEQLSKKERVESLTTQYNSCSSDLIARKSNVDTSSAYAVDSYNSDSRACEQVRLDQNAAANEYNQSIGL